MKNNRILEPVPDKSTSSALHFRNLVINSLTGVVPSTVDGTLTYVNQALANIFEYDSPQEMLGVFKHAHASQVTVGMHWTAEKLEIIVDDDGIGFTDETLSKISPDSESFGLLSISELMSGLGGSFQINNQKGGVTACLAVPLKSSR